jgi:hypothetical protein
MDTGGSEVVTIGGSNFGPSSVDAGEWANVVGAVYESEGLEGLGGIAYVASECVVTVSHMTMECSSVAGVGAGHRWSLQVGNQTGAASDAGVVTSYARPSIWYFNAEAQDSPGLSTDGSDMVTITGSQFGPVHSMNNVSASYQNELLEGLGGELFNASSCSVTVAHTEMVCSSTEGVGYGHHWTVDVGGQINTVSNASTSYMAPALLSFDPKASVSPGLDPDGDRITITGANFGPIHQLNKVDAAFRHVDRDIDATVYKVSNCNVSVAHVEIVCYDVEGIGGDRHRWSVRCGNVSTPYSGSTTFFVISDQPKALAGSSNFSVVDTPKTLVFRSMGFAGKATIRWIFDGGACDGNRTAETFVNGQREWPLDSRGRAIFVFTHVGQGQLCLKANSTAPYVRYSNVAMVVGGISAFKSLAGDPAIVTAGASERLGVVGAALSLTDRIGWVKLPSNDYSGYTCPMSELVQLATGGMTTTVQELYATPQMAPSNSTNIGTNGTRISPTVSSYDITVIASAAFPFQSQLLALCYGFGNEPMRLYRNLTTLRVVGVGTAAMGGSSQLAVVGMPKTIGLLGTGLQTGDQVKWVVKPNMALMAAASTTSLTSGWKYGASDCTAVDGWPLQEGLSATPVVSNELSVWADGLGAAFINVTFLSPFANTSATLHLCYRPRSIADTHSSNDLEAYTAYPHLNLTVAQLQSVSAPHEQTDNFSLVGFATQLNFDGVGVKDGDSVRWITDGESDSDCNDEGKLVRFQQGNLGNEVTEAVLSGSANSSILSSSFYFLGAGASHRLCYRFATESFKLYSADLHVHEVGVALPPMACSFAIGTNLSYIHASIKEQMSSKLSFSKYVRSLEVQVLSDERRRSLAARALSEVAAVEVEVVVVTSGYSTQEIQADLFESVQTAVQELGGLINDPPLPSPGDVHFIADFVVQATGSKWQAVANVSRFEWSGFGANINGSVLRYRAAIGTQPFGTNVTNGFVDVGSANNATLTDLVLHDGESYFATIACFSENGFFSLGTSSVPITVDTSPPSSNLAAVNVTRSDDTPLGPHIEWSADNASIALSFAGFVDVGAPIRGYSWAVGTNDTNDTAVTGAYLREGVVLLSANSTNSSTTHGTMPAIGTVRWPLHVPGQPGVFYYASVRAQDSLGHWSSPRRSHPFRVDTTVPSRGYVVDVSVLGTAPDGSTVVHDKSPSNATSLVQPKNQDIEWQAELTSLSGSWGDFRDGESTVTRYEIAAGASPTLTDVSAGFCSLDAEGGLGLPCQGSWSMAARPSNYSRENSSTVFRATITHGSTGARLRLKPAGEVRYFFVVRAYNKAGAYTQGHSDGVRTNAAVSFVDHHGGHPPHMNMSKSCEARLNDARLLPGKPIVQACVEENVGSFSLALRREGGTAASVWIHEMGVKLGGHRLRVERREESGCKGLDAGGTGMSVGGNASISVATSTESALPTPRTLLYEPIEVKFRAGETSRRLCLFVQDDPDFDFGKPGRIGLSVGGTNESNPYSSSWMGKMRELGRQYFDLGAARCVPAAACVLLIEIEDDEDWKALIPVLIAMMTIVFITGSAHAPKVDNPFPRVNSQVIDSLENPNAFCQASLMGVPPDRLSFTTESRAGMGSDKEESAGAPPMRPAARKRWQASLQLACTDPFANGVHCTAATAEEREGTRMLVQVVAEEAAAKQAAAERQRQAPLRSLQFDSVVRIQARIRARLDRVRQIKAMAGQLSSCLALPGTVHGSSGYYETWVDHQNATMVAKARVSAETGEWTIEGGPWSRLAWVNGMRDECRNMDIADKARILQGGEEKFQRKHHEKEKKAAETDERKEEKQERKGPQQESKPTHIADSISLSLSAGLSSPHFHHTAQEPPLERKLLDHFMGGNSWNPKLQGQCFVDWSDEDVQEMRRHFRAMLPILQGEQESNGRQHQQSRRRKRSQQQHVLEEEKEEFATNEGDRTRTVVSNEVDVTNERPLIHDTPVISDSALVATLRRDPDAASQQNLEAETHTIRLAMAGRRFASVGALSRAIMTSANSLPRTMVRICAHNTATAAAAEKARLMTELAVERATEHLVEALVAEGLAAAVVEQFSEKKKTLLMASYALRHLERQAHQICEHERQKEGAADLLRRWLLSDERASKKHQAKRQWQQIKESVDGGAFDHTSSGGGGSSVRGFADAAKAIQHDQQLQPLQWGWWQNGFCWEVYAPASLIPDESCGPHSGRYAEMQIVRMQAIARMRSAQRKVQGMRVARDLLRAKAVTRIQAFVRMLTAQARTTEMAQARSLLARLDASLPFVVKNERAESSTVSESREEVSLLSTPKKNSDARATAGVTMGTVTITAADVAAGVDLAGNEMNTDDVVVAAIDVGHGTSASVDGVSDVHHAFGTDANACSAEATYKSTADTEALRFAKVQAMYASAYDSLGFDAGIDEHQVPSSPAPGAKASISELALERATEHALEMLLTDGVAAASAATIAEETAALAAVHAAEAAASAATLAGEAAIGAAVHAMMQTAAVLHDSQVLESRRIAKVEAKKQARREQAKSDAVKETARVIWQATTYTKALYSFVQEQVVRAQRLRVVKELVAKHLMKQEMHAIEEAKRREADADELGRKRREEEDMGLRLEQLQEEKRREGAVTLLQATQRGKARKASMANKKEAAIKLQGSTRARRNAKEERQRRTEEEQTEAEERARKEAAVVLQSKVRQGKALVRVNTKKRHHGAAVVLQSKVRQGNAVREAHVVATRRDAEALANCRAAALTAARSARSAADTAVMAAERAGYESLAGKARVVAASMACAGATHARSMINALGTLFRDPRAVQELSECWSTRNEEEKEETEKEEAQVREKAKDKAISACSVACNVSAIAAVTAKMLASAALDAAAGAVADALAARERALSDTEVIVVALEDGLREEMMTTVEVLNNAGGRAGGGTGSVEGGPGSAGGGTGSVDAGIMRRLSRQRLATINGKANTRSDAIEPMFELQSAIEPAAKELGQGHEQDRRRHRRRRQHEHQQHQHEHRQQQPQLLPHDEDSKEGEVTAVSTQAGVSGMGPIHAMLRQSGSEHAVTHALLPVGFLRTDALQNGPRLSLREGSVAGSVTGSMVGSDVLEQRRREEEQQEQVRQDQQAEQDEQQQRRSKRKAGKRKKARKGIAPD